MEGNVTEIAPVALALLADHVQAEQVVQVIPGAERGFALCDHLTAEDMQARYLMLAGGVPTGRILDLSRLAQAHVARE